MVKDIKIKIGNIELNSPFILAPLAGVSDSPFRRICKEQGASLVYSEMVSAKGLYFNDKNTDRLLTFYNDEKPIAYQLFGSDPEIMAWAVSKLSDRKNAILDVNMGCPVSKVVRNGEGSALMKTPKTAAKIIASMVKMEKQQAEKDERDIKPITVKCRTGWDQKNINVLDFAMLMEEAGASAIAVHGRTKEQNYSGKADWEMIAGVKTKVAIPVIGSGDVYTGEDANRMLQETGCDLVMIARGALGNPWIFSDSIAIFRGKSKPSPLTLEEKLSMLCRHLELLVKEKGEKTAILEMRKHVGWYLKGIPGATEIRRRVNTLTTLSALKETLKLLFS